MKRLLILLLVISTSSIYIISQNTIATWPILGKKAGGNILYKPQDYLGTEKIFGDIFIGASEGTIVLSPIDGTITSFGYQYSSSLFTSSSYSASTFSTKGIAEFDLQQRKNIAQQSGLNPQFVCIAICISGVSGEKYYLSGIRPIKIIKTGQKIKKGDVLGSVGYCFKSISEPCIWLSRSIDGKSADPMLPFGIKSTYIAAKPELIRQIIPRAELLADFRVFREALEEGHPGLYDYTTKENMDSTFERVKLKITEPMSSSRFLGILYPVLDSLRDGHTILRNMSGQLEKIPQKDNSNLPIHFGFQKDSLLVFQAVSIHSNLLGKQIIKINNDSASSLLKRIKFSANREGKIQVKRDFYFLNYFSSFFKTYKKFMTGDTVSIVFSDGTETKLEYKALNSSDFFPKRIPRTRTIESNLSIRTIDSLTSYLRVRTFGFSSIDVDTLQAYMKTLIHSSSKNLIIDVRDNPGGNSHNQLFSTISNQPFKSETASMVKSNAKYLFLRNSPSYSGIDTVVLFPTYKRIEGKSGYYLENDKFEMPNDSIHFDGNIFLLTNENSNSASTLFAALVHKYNRGTIIGRETGNCYYQMNAVKFVTVRLKNSNLDLSMPLVKVIFDEKIDKFIPWGRGVIPDYNIDWTFKEALNQEDTILNFTLDLIQKSQTTR